MKISVKMLNTVFVLILLYHIAFVKFPYIENNNMIKYILTVLVGISLLNNVKKIKKSIDKKMILFIIIYILIVIISGVLNRGKMEITNVLIGSVMYVAIVIEFFCCFSLIKRENMFNLIIITFFYVSLIYLVLTDLLILLKPGLFMKKGEYYLIGNKFNVVYLHLQMIIFYLLKNKSKRGINITVVLLSFITCFISIKVECMTGIVGLIIMMILYNISPKVITKGHIALVILIASCSFSFIYEYVLNINVVQQFIIGILHRSLTLTGRITIYENIPKVLENNLWFGYGYGTSYEIWMQKYNYPNSQNGLIDLIVEQGLIASIIIVTIIVTIINKVKNSKIQIINQCYPIVMMIYIFFILSSFEITLGLSCLAWCALLYANLVNEKKEELLNENFNIIDAKSN